MLPAPVLIAHRERREGEPDLPKRPPGPGRSPGSNGPFAGFGVRLWVRRLSDIMCDVRCDPEVDLV